MPNKTKIVALIPARAGSKRLPGKNILDLAGKPLIAWTIEAALGCDEIDNVVVSSDSDIIRDVALSNGASVPFERPAKLASDSASTDDVLLHAIDELDLDSDDILVLLQPTSPLRDNNDISEALQLIEGDVKGVVSVCECEHSPMWCNTLPASQLMGGFIPKDIASKRSQDLPQYYRLNGAIYAYRVSYLKKNLGRVYSDAISAFVMENSKSIDIDDVDDFLFASFKLESRK
ncbi:cytidylyltransferase domain-containing protein [Agarivorans albus]|uniref:N-Acetylneuraminate cytidylyltransferase n=1 Tax=Agarivorans albus MKT 106 TaxID=1331007 RepID=R9PN99_AGAAL|nr:acylneuraminate cytidylyltransferase family protein [Agarivorans albus]GAD02758.1 N-Acetylneuraminate cytidylyltransferase [Agarivorans albus MKT 106]